MSPDPSHQQIGKSVGAKLREARLAKKFTQSQLAGEDFSVSYISAIERGQIHPSLRALEIFANRLGLSSKDLLANYAQNGNADADSSEQERAIDEADWQLLLALSEMNQGGAQQAILRLRDTLSHPTTPEQQLFLTYALALALYHNRQWQESEQVLADLAQRLKDSDDVFSIHILHLQGVLHASMHNYTQGLAIHQRCLEQLEGQAMPDPLLLIQVYSHLGNHLFHLERLQEAQEAFAAALELLRVLTPEQRLAAYQQAFEQQTEKYDHALATLSGYKSLQLLAHSRVEEQRSLLYHFMGKGLLTGQDGEEQARLSLEELLEQATREQDALFLASMHTHLATWHLARQAHGRAMTHAQQAMACLADNDDHAIAADTLLVLGKVNYAQQHFEEGDPHFEAGLAMLERLEYYEDLANEAAYYAEQLEQRNEIRRSVTYWKKALDCRQRMKR